MEFRTLSDNSIYEYHDYVDDDIAENMIRLYYRGIASHDPDDSRPLSLLIWELKSVEDLRDTESELKWIYTADSSFLSPLLEEYGKEAQEEAVKKTFFESPPMESGEEAAFGACGFSLKHTESRDLHVTIEECRRLPVAKGKAPRYVESILYLDSQEFFQGIMNILFKHENPALEDLAYLPKNWYEQSVSCYTRTDGRISGFLLVHKCPSGILVPVLLFAVGADFKKSLMEMMRFSINRAAELYPEDTVIRIHRRNQEVAALSKKFFPDKKGDPAVAGKRTEGE